MRFSVQREAFLKPLRSVAGVVERRHLHNLPILSHVLIAVDGDHFSLTTTDQEVELIAGGMLEKSAEPFQVTVPFRKLMDICRALPEDGLIEFTEEGDRVIIRSGRSRFALSTLPAADFPSLNENIGDVNFSLPTKALSDLLDSTCFAMADQDVRYYLNGMLIEVKEGRLFSVAADGHRLALNTVAVSGFEDKSLRIIVPRKGVLELQRILGEGDDEISLIIGSNHLRAVTGTVTLTTKLLEGRFPEYDRIIPKNGDKIVEGNRNEMKEAFHRAGALFSDKFRGVKLRLASGCLKILATNTEQDEVEEDIEVDYLGDDLEIGFNVKYLIDFLNVIQEDRVRFTFLDANSSAKVEGIGGKESSVYIIMPMRI
jgi:DNA polymerase-3 subunit beta